MNGRFYDPVLGRFLSPDPYVQAPDNPQNFNRYSYCLNNPLKYTDPSGEFWHIIIGAAIGGVANLVSGIVTHKIDNVGKGFAYFGIGALAGAASAATCGGISSAMAGTGFAAGFTGSATAATATSCFASGALIGGAGGAISGSVTGFGNTLLDGGSFAQAIGQLHLQSLIGAASGAVVGGLVDGINAMNNDCNFWNGNPNTLLDEIDYHLPYCPNEGSNDCFVKSAESIETNFGPNHSTSTEIRQKIGKVNNELITVDEMREVGYDIRSVKGIESAYKSLKDYDIRAFHAKDWGDGTRHMTAVNKIQMWQRANGKIYYRLYTMDSARGQYIKTSIQKIYLLTRIKRW